MAQGLWVCELRRVVRFFDRCSWQFLGHAAHPPMPVREQTVEWCVRIIRGVTNTDVLEQAWEQICRQWYIGHVSG